MVGGMMTGRNIVTASFLCKRGDQPKSDGWHRAGWDGYVIRYETDFDLTTLMHNLAIAGALTKAFRLGDTYGWDMGWNDANHHGQVTDEWRPNSDGRAAP